MLLFDAYQNGAPATQVDLVGAYLIGQESVPIRAEITASGGRVTCEKKTVGAAALAVLWDAGSAGRLMLQTTRLPEREEPYILNLELARSRLMQLIQKREEWGLFDYPSAEHLGEELEQTKGLFIQAMKVGAKDPAAASTLADQCLEQAINLSEKTALFHADIFLQRRIKTNGFSRPTFGAVVDVNVTSGPYLTRLGEGFDFFTLPALWKNVEPQEGQLKLENLDAWVQKCGQHRIPLHVGPLISMEPRALPEWSYIWEHDFESLRDMIYEHIRQIVSRYAKRVRLWNVVSALHAFNTFGHSFEQIMELTRMSCSLVKKLAPQSIVMIDLSLPWGEYYARNQRTIPPMMYVDMCVQSGVKFDAFGLQVYLGAPADGLFVRDLMQLSTKLDEFNGTGKPLHITACQAPSDSQPDPGDFWAGQAKPEQAGRWHKPWNPTIQAEWLTAFYQLALSKPFVETICWRDLSDGPGHFLPHGGLCKHDLSPKPAYDRHVRLRSAIANANARGAAAVPNRQNGQAP